MCACVIGLLYTCASLACHKIMTEQMPSSSPRGLVQVLPMVLLSALSSEYFLTWLLNMLWAGTWHRAALAPKALVLFQTKCHCASPRSASEEGQAERSGRGTLHPGHDTARRIFHPHLNAASGGLGGQSSTCVKPETCEHTGWAGGCLTLCRVQAAPGGTSVASGPGLAVSKDLCGIPRERGEPAWVLHRLNLGLVQLRRAPFVSFCRCLHLLTDCRDCWGSSALASTP